MSTESNTPSSTPAKNKRLGLLLLAVVAVLAGVIANKAVYRKSPEAAANREAMQMAQSQAEEKKQLSELQSDLANTAVFPSDFRSIPAFNLLDQQSQAVSESLFSGQWSMVFFGYTHCPDICPMTMTIMNSVSKTLAEQQIEDLQVVFISVDPKRDTADILGKYMAFFNPEFKGITGELADVLALTNELGIVASYTTIEGTDDYLVDHTASMLLIDPQGRVRAKFNAPHEAETIVSDYQKIINSLS